MIFSANLCFGYERIFYENCESTNFTNHFLERSYGTGVASYWQEFTSEVSRSSLSPHSGNNCMMYDPWTTRNPHAVVGYDGATYGNTSHLALSSVNARYWYFRWYQRWEEGINWSGSAQQKIFYLNYMHSGDFVIMIQKSNNNGFHTEIKHVAPDYYYVTGGNMYYKNYNNNNLDDMQWHLFEVYVDAGTTGNHNGVFWMNIDGHRLKTLTGFDFNQTIHSNPIHNLTGWPANTSGSPSGTCRNWLDDLEIYLLDGPDDIPPIAEFW